MAEIKLLRSREPFREAGRRLARQMWLCHEQQGAVRLAIPGGSVLAALAAARKFLDAELWARTQLTWVDERRVPLEHPDSNRGEAYRQHILDPGDPPGAELPLFLEGEDPAQACRRVEAALEKDFDGGLDVLLLGMGEDGHIASLFPGCPWAPPPARVELVEHSPKPPSERLSLTQSFLASAPDAVLVVTGESKREALRRLLAGDPLLPASALPRLVVVTDLN